MGRYDEHTALLVVDMQNDFADPAGALHVPGGEQVVATVNREIAAAQAAGATVVYTQDWHPASTPHFAKDGGVWPVHCVAGTWGAGLVSGLRVTGPVVRKGTGGEDGYSAFTVRDPVSGSESTTGLSDRLDDAGVRRVVVVGLATDYCVKDSALDAARHGYATTVLAEAVRPVDRQPGDGQRALADLAAAGVEVVPPPATPAGPEPDRRPPPARAAPATPAGPESDHRPPLAPAPRAPDHGGGGSASRAPGRAVRIDVAGVGLLDAELTVATPGGPAVVFAHGSGSSRRSPRNRAVARRLQQAGFATLLLDLLTVEEEQVERRGGQLRFDVDELAGRLVTAVEWLEAEPGRRPERIGYFGASTGAASALIAAARQGARISAVVSRGGRPDLAGEALPRVRAPTLLIVGSLDPGVLELNEHAYAQLAGDKQLEVVPGATHLFEEPGTLEQVAELAAGWFGRWLARAAAGRSRAEAGRSRAAGKRAAVSS